MIEERKRNRVRVGGVDSDTAFEVLAVLGPGASVEDLRRKIEMVYGRAPSHATLSSWWDRFSWADRLKQRWSELHEATREYLRENNVETHADRVVGLKHLCREMLQIANTMVSGGGKHPSGKFVIPPLKLTGKPGELQTLMSTMIAASQHMELLTGGATDRVETRQLLGDLNDELLTTEFAKRFGMKVSLDDTDGDGKPH